VIFKIKNLGEICKFQGGSQPPKSNFIYEPKNGYIRFLQIRDFGSEKNHTYIPEDNKNKICNSDDIMIGRYGASVGKILRGKSGAYNVALMKATPLNSFVNKEYLWNYFQSSIFQDDLRKVASRSAQDGFSKDDIFNFKVPLPPLPIQQKIVEKLDAIFSEIDKAKAAAEANVKNVEALFKSYLRDAYKGDKNWKTVALGDICTIVNGGTPKSEVSEYWDGDLNWITPKEMGKLTTREITNTERKITEKGIKNSSAKLLPINSVILSSRAPIGHLAINKSLMATNQGCKGLVPSERLNYEYLYYFLSHSKQLLNDMGSGTTFKELSGSKLSTVEIPLPNLTIQQDIISKINKISSEVSKLNNLYENKLSDLLFFKQSILKQAFNGELVKAA